MTWQIDNSHSHIGFSVKHMMIATVRGEFKAYTGTLALDTDDLTQSVFTGEIDIASIDTRESKRDEHLRSADFFDAETYPTMTFKSTRVEPIDGNEYRIVGDLTIKGITKEVVLEAEYAGIHKDPWGNTRTGFTASATLDRKDFGLSWNAALETGGVLVGEKVKLSLDIEAVLQEAAVAAV
jgi:polyisoprenoid-binding protein YceI